MTAPDKDGIWNHLLPDEQFKLDKNVKTQVQEKLEEFLRLNSEHLSGKIQKHFDKSTDPKYISLEDKVEGLCLVAWERKQFLLKVLQMQKAFKQMMRAVKISVNSKLDRSVA